jgi:hypothetical protein
MSKGWSQISGTKKSLRAKITNDKNLEPIKKENSYRDNTTTNAILVAGLKSFLRKNFTTNEINDLKNYLENGKLNIAVTRFLAVTKMTEKDLKDVKNIFIEV